MPYQVALTIVAPVRAGARGEPREPARDDGRRRRERLGARLRCAHGRPLRAARPARGDDDLDGAACPRTLILTERRRRRARRAPRRARRDRGPGIDAVFGALRGLPGGATDRGSATCARHVVKEQARYVNTAGRTVAPDPAGGRAARRDRGLPRRAGATGAAAIRREVRAGGARATSRGDPALAWALEPAERPAARRRVREKLHLVGDPAPAPAAAAAAPRRAAGLRRRAPRIHERRDVAPHVKPERGAASTSSPRSRITSSRTRSRRSATSSRACSGG